MFSRKRILYLGSISILLLSGLMFVAHTNLIPTAHAVSCDTVAHGAINDNGFWIPDWHYVCSVSTTQYSDSNLTVAIQEIVNSYLGTNASCKTPLTVDGNFGSDTKTAVICFQKAEHQSYQGGTVGTATWDNLAAYVGQYGCIPCNGNQSDWQYFSSDGSDTADFRVYIAQPNPSYTWYVKPFGTSTWYQMNTGDSDD